METIIRLKKMSSGDLYASVLRMTPPVRKTIYYYLTGTNVSSPTWKDFENAVKSADLRQVKRRWLLEQIKTATNTIRKVTGEDRACLQEELKELRKELKNGFTES